MLLPPGRRRWLLPPIAAAGLAGLLGCGRAAEVAPPPEAPERPVIAAEGEPFVDVTAAAGIDFVHHFGDATMDNIVESLGSGASWLDFDGDGDLDLYLVDQGWLPGVSAGERPAAKVRNRLYENLGGGSFREVPAAAGAADDGYGFAAAVGDVDNDGDADLLVANCGPNRLYVNRGDKTFRRAEGAGVEDGRCTAAATFFDYDRDGFLDVYLANYLTFDPEYTLHYAPDVFPGPMAYEPQADALLRNRGDATFVDVSAAAGIAVDPGRAMGVVATDFDGDGWTDVFVANDATANFLFRNRGDRSDGPGRGDGPSFEEVGALWGVAFGFRGEATGAMAGVVGDLDGDGRPDLLVTDTTYGSLYRNREDGLFEDLVMRSGLAAPSGQWVSWGGGFFDFENDGDLDVFQVNGDLKRLTGRPDLLLANRGDRGDGPSFDLAEGGAYFRAELPGRGGAFADFDDDGDLDVLVTVLGASPVLLRNDVAGRGHWLGVALRGVESNRDGLGAVVTVEAGGQRWVGIRHAPAGYLTQNDPRLHFGLGELERVERLEVAWPSGAVDAMEDLEVDRYVEIEEGRGEP
jgi:hypothetical protein